MDWKNFEAMEKMMKKEMSHSSNIINNIKDEFEAGNFENVLELCQKIRMEDDIFSAFPTLRIYQAKSFFMTGNYDKFLSIIEEFYKRWWPDYLTMTVEQPKEWDSKF